MGLREYAVLPLLALGLAIAAVTPAAAEEASISPSGVELRMTPEKAGTKGQPTGLELEGLVRFPALESGERRFVTHARLLLPRGMVYNGARYPTCSKATLEGRDGGAGSSDCPEASIVGATFNSWTGDPRPRILFVNGGARLLLAQVTLFNPAFVQEPVPIGVRKLRGPRWAYELSVEVAPVLQEVAGVLVPLELDGLRFYIGGRAGAPRYLATTRAGCPKRGFLPYKTTLGYLHANGVAGEFDRRGRLACR